VFISYSISGALALYWITSNVFSIAQEMWIKKKYHKTPPIVV
jgi:membrane protein insertase Oxa1/YidC/SpoIIIJ